MIAESRSWPARGFWFCGRTVRSLVLVSAVIWLLTLPLVMARFHLLTPTAIVLNTLLWLPMAVALMTGFATLVFGVLFPPLGHVFGACCNGTLYTLESTVNYARELPGSHFWVPGPTGWWLVGFYGCLALWAAFPAIRPPRRWCLAGLAGWVAVGFAAAGLRQDTGRLNCTFLSVGHGCAVVVQLPSGQTMLYDAGRLGSPTSAEQSIAGFLWSRGITHLDAVILSHNDIDHCNALPGLLERFSVGAIYVSPFMWEKQNAAITALGEAIDAWGGPLATIEAGCQLRGGPDCSIDVFWPSRQADFGSSNARSIVVDVTYLGRHILLCGDLESAGLDAVLAEGPVDCAVLMAPHHGGRRSNPPRLAAWSRPQWVVVSGSYRWESAPVTAAYETIGAQVVHTAESGAVRVTIDRGGMEVTQFLPPAANGRSSSDSQGFAGRRRAD
jgi:competence protein ComEC